MSSLAANPFGVALALVGKIMPAMEGYLTRPEASDGAPGWGAVSNAKAGGMAAHFLRSERDNDSGLGFVCRPISRFLGHCFGGKPAPGGNSLFCFGNHPTTEQARGRGPRFCAALRITVSLQILFGKYTENVCQDPP